MNHSTLSESIADVCELERRLSEPSPEVVETLRRVPGDILVLGAGGKIGVSLALMGKRASDQAGVARRITAVSRFSHPAEREKLEQGGVETLRCDLLDEQAVERLPSAPNVMFLAGHKFGTSELAAYTWAINAFLPTVICRRYRASRIVAFSTGTLYGLTSVAEGGSRESESPQAVGEYAASCLGRERLFEFFSRRDAIPVALLRLFYACELRYGVLVDLAWKVRRGEPIDLTMGYFNIIWQGDSNALAFRMLEHASSPPFVLNLTGPETLSIREVALEIGRRLGTEPRFVAAESPTACLGNASRCQELFGRPRVGSDQLIEWVSDWVRRGGECHGKPTHYEVRDGKF